MLLLRTADVDSPSFTLSGCDGNAASSEPPFDRSSSPAMPAEQMMADTTRAYRRRRVRHDRAGRPANKSPDTCPKVSEPVLPFH